MSEKEPLPSDSPRAAHSRSTVRAYYRRRYQVHRKVCPAFPRGQGEENFSFLSKVEILFNKRTILCNEKYNIIRDNVYLTCDKILNVIKYLI